MTSEIKRTDRRIWFHSFVSPQCYGLEIGPLHSPIFPKRDGFKCLSIDVFDQATLRKNYKNNPLVDQIESVDILFSHSLLESWRHFVTYFAAEDLKPDKLSYIASSHNFEHQPNPIRFLCDAAEMLADDGQILMAIPISTRCFDCTMPLSTTGQLIDAMLRRDVKPSAGSVFDARANFALMDDGSNVSDINYRLDRVNLESFHRGISHLTFTDMMRKINTNYIDAHCWRFSHYSFELIFRDLVAYGLLKGIVIDEIQENGAEFLVRIIKSQDYYSDFSPSERSELAAKSLLFYCNEILSADRA